MLGGPWRPSYYLETGETSRAGELKQRNDMIWLESYTHTPLGLIWKTEHRGQDRSRGGKGHNRRWWPALQWQPERGWKTSRVWRYLGKAITVEHETRRRMKENTKIRGLKIWKKEVATYWDGQDYRRSRSGTGNKLGFFNVGLDNSLQCLLVHMMMSWRQSLQMSELEI